MAYEIFEEMNKICHFLAKVLFTAYIWQWKELSLQHNPKTQTLWLGIISTGTSG